MEKHRISKTVMTNKIKKALQKESNPPELEYHLKNIQVNGRKMGCSGFVKNPDNGKIVYINSDVLQYSKKSDILYREAEHLQDYHGKTNQYADVSKIGEAIVAQLRTQFL